MIWIVVNYFNYMGVARRCRKKYIPVVNFNHYHCHKFLPQNKVSMPSLLHLDLKFLSQNVFTIYIFYLRYRLDNFFYIIFFDNRPPSRSADSSGDSGLFLISDVSRLNFARLSVAMFFFEESVME